MADSLDPIGFIIIEVGTPSFALWRTIWSIFYFTKHKCEIDSFVWWGHLIELGVSIAAIAVHIPRFIEHGELIIKASNQLIEYNISFILILAIWVILCGYYHIRIFNTIDDSTPDLLGNSIDSESPKNNMDCDINIFDVESIQNKDQFNDPMEAGCKCNKKWMYIIFASLLFSAVFVTNYYVLAAKYRPKLNINWITPWIDYTITILDAVIIRTLLIEKDIWVSAWIGDVAFHISEFICVYA
eukprot:800473_1